jgi:hypothetical protein
VHDEGLAVYGRQLRQRSFYLHSLTIALGDDRRTARRHTAQ